MHRKMQSTTELLLKTLLVRRLIMKTLHPSDINKLDTIVAVECEAGSYSTSLVRIDDILRAMVNRKSEEIRILHLIKGFLHS